MDAREAFLGRRPRGPAAGTLMHVLALGGCETVSEILPVAVAGLVR